MIAGRALIPGESLNPKRVVSLGLIVTAPLFIVLQVNSCYAIEYANYTSDKYQIQFQYPSNWTLHEKTNRFEQGTGITISSNNHDHIGVTLSDLDTTDLQAVVFFTYDSVISDIENQPRPIESPTFLDIDNQRSGTFLITVKEVLASQYWITLVGNSNYMINYFSPVGTFDSPENTEIRDHFIKSIKFLGVNNPTNDTKNWWDFTAK